MNLTKDKDIYNFLVNNDFINYVVNPNHILKKTWESFFKSNPELINVAEEARKILLGEIISQEKPRQEELLAMKNCVLNNIIIS